jgi:hypothetical protein
MRIDERRWFGIGNDFDRYSERDEREMNLPWEIPIIRRRRRAIAKSGIESYESPVRRKANNDEPSPWRSRGRHHGLDG